METNHIRDKKQNKANKQTKIEMTIEKQKIYSTTIDIANIERVNIKIIKKICEKRKSNYEWYKIKSSNIEMIISAN